jgi:hypothetical protein
VASLRNCGLCTCPCCLAHKPELSQFSTQLDIVQCMSLAWVDNHAARHDIEDACCKIYKGKYSVNAKVVEELLKGESRVPTSVSNVTYTCVYG